MKTNKKRTIYPTISACAGAENVPLAVLKLAKRRGADGFRNTRVYWDELCRWAKKTGFALKTTKATSSPAPIPAAVPQPVEPLRLGAGGALSRLEAVEGDLYTRMQADLTAGRDATAARDAWLEASEALRKQDLSVEAFRRQTGQLVPLEDVTEALVHFMHTFRLSFLAAAEGIGNRLVEVRHQTDPVVFISIMREFVPSLNAMVFGNLRAWHHWGKPFPEWLREPFEKHFRETEKNWEADISYRAEFFTYVFKHWGEHFESSFLKNPNQPQQTTEGKPQ